MRTLTQQRSEDDPNSGAFGTCEDICPDCYGSGMQLDRKGNPTAVICERCDGSGIIIEGIG
jgi:DnaJ-class molecular chaperone